MDSRRIGKKLIKLRGRRKQIDIAKEIGISASALSMYESGERVPRDEIKKRISKYYKKTVEELFFK